MGTRGCQTWKTIGLLKRWCFWVDHWQEIRREYVRCRMLFLRQKADVSRRGNRCLYKCRGAFRKFPWSSDILRPWKVLHWFLEENAVSDLREEQLGLSLGDILSQRSWAGYLRAHWRLARNALPLADVDFEACTAEMFDCVRCSRGLEETSVCAFYNCKQVQMFWDYVEYVKVHIDPKLSVLFDADYIVDR